MVTGMYSRAVTDSFLKKAMLETSSVLSRWEAGGNAEAGGVLEQRGHQDRTDHSKHLCREQGHHVGASTV